MEDIFYVSSGLKPTGSETSGISDFRGQVGTWHMSSGHVFLLLSAWVAMQHRDIGISPKNSGIQKF